VGWLTEHVGLRKRSEDGDLITEDLAGWPRDTSRRRINAIYNKLSSTSDVVNGVFENLGGSGGLDDNVKTIWVFCLELLELNLRVLT